MAPSTDRIFTPRFFVMCGFTFAVFLSAFQLLPTVPFHIRELGGSTFASGLFLGFLTYASAFSGPLTGAVGDRIGARPTLAACSLAIAALSAAYAVIDDYRWLLALVVIHGVFWSALLSNSGAYLTNMLPERRRAEGIGYWGLSSVAALAVAPPVGFWLYHRGWFWLCVVCVILNLAMAVIAWTLRDAPPGTRESAPRPSVEPNEQSGGIMEWRVLALSLSLFLYSFGYGGITSFSAVYAEVLGVTPKGIYLTTLAVVILATRPLAGPLADRIGYRRVFVPCLSLISAGLALLAAGGTRPSMMLSAVVFGIGFGTAYPVFVAYVMKGVAPHRRGAAFGAILAAFDTGIGTGSTSLGWLIQRYGFRQAFGLAAGISALALPYFLLADRQLTRNTEAGTPQLST